MLSENSIQKFQEYLEKVKAGTDQGNSCYLQLNFSVGELDIWVAVNASPRYNENNELTHFVLFPLELLLSQIVLFCVVSLWLKVFILIFDAFFPFVFYVLIVYCILSFLYLTMKPESTTDFS